MGVKNIWDTLSTVQDTVKEVEERFESVDRLREHGIDVIMGNAVFKNAHTLEVTNKTETKIVIGRKFVIATGGEPAQVTTKGFETLEYKTNRNIFLPKGMQSLTIVGSGPIGCELAQAFARLGLNVTLIARDSILLNREDIKASQIIQDAFAKDGVNVLYNAELVEGYRDQEKKCIKVKFSNGGEERAVSSDEVLVAVGRVPNVEGMGLETIGVLFDKRNGIIVNDHAQTKVPHIYAVGDVASKLKFTHFANHHAKVAVTHMFFKIFGKVEKEVIPRVTFTTPEVASVGISTSKEATEMGYLVFSKNYSDVDRAITDGNEVGFFQIITDKRGFIKGATLVGTSAGELINEIALAMKHKITITSLADTIHAYPTYGYGLRSCADQFRASGYTPKMKQILKTILSLHGKN
jgi:pyruvate/2-oxoglutarate dehydrogenase complex dihydrolipoamide dehydrogenase (E3) component